MDDFLCPFKRSSLHIVGFKESVDCCAYLLRRGEASVPKHPSRKNAEPDLYLVEPTRLRWSEVKVHVLVSGKPPIVFGFVRT